MFNSLKRGDLSGTNHLSLSLPPIPLPNTMRILQSLQLYCNALLSTHKFSALAMVSVQLVTLNKLHYQFGSKHCTCKLMNMHDLVSHLHQSWLTGPRTHTPYRAPDTRADCCHCLQATLGASPLGPDRSCSTSSKLRMELPTRHVAMGPPRTAICLI